MHANFFISWCGRPERRQERSNPLESRKMSTKILAAAVIAAATASLAFAQGTPPRPASNPAVGAGQRSTQNTPMGTTGTPGGGAAGAQGAATGSAAAMSAGSTGASGSMNSGASASADGSGGGAMASGTHVAKRSHRRAKADRN
jgi:hypothetical protein